MWRMLWNKNLLDGYTPTNDLLNDAKQIIEVSQKAAYRAVNLTLVQCNWLLGYRIAQEELKGEGRSEYGMAVIRKLAKELTAEYGKGFDYSSLYKYFRFYKLYPEIVDSVSPQSGALLSWNALSCYYCRLRTKQPAIGTRKKRPLPTEEELRAEIGTQKEMFYLQHNQNK